MRISGVGAGESAGCWCAKGVVDVSNGRCYGDVTVNVCVYNCKESSSSNKIARKIEGRSMDNWLWKRGACVPTQYQLILQLGAQVGENEVKVACRDELSGLVMQFVVV